MTWADITGPSRRADIVLARHSAIYLIWRKYPEMTLLEIGELVGGRSPATVFNAIQQTIKRLRVLTRCVIIPLRYAEHTDALARKH